MTAVAERPVEKAPLTYEQLLERYQRVMAKSKRKTKALRDLNTAHVMTARENQALRQSVNDLTRANSRLREALENK